MSAEPLRAVIIGAGHRSLLYSSYARHHPDELRIVGVAEPADHKRERVRARYDIPPERCFRTAGELARVDRFADAAINGTMDADHVPTTVPLLEKGYHVLLEKPFAVTEEEARVLAEAARVNDRRVMICHVLRYAPFYRAIRERVAAGAVGEIVNIQTAEHVRYHHMAAAYVRGKWNREDLCGSSMLMAKCCHDLDLLVWMKSGVRPVRVAGFGSRAFFRPENAPENAGEFCLLDCPIEADCPYSARKHYLERGWWKCYCFEGISHIENPTDAQKEDYLKRTDHNYGRCVWKCDNEVVDRQSVTVEFEDAATATLNMIGGTIKGMRNIHILGTEGEIQGEFETSRFFVRRFYTGEGPGYAEEEVDLNVTDETSGMHGGHGGGDLRLVGDFVRTVRGEAPSISCTSLEDSLYSHLVGFAAERARREGRVVEIERA